MTSHQFSDPYIQGSWTDSEPKTRAICPSSRIHMIIHVFQNKEGQLTMGGFEPTASQIRGDLNQAMLPDLLQRTMLINTITENSLRKKITVWIVRNLAKIYFLMMEVRQPFLNYNMKQDFICFFQLIALEFSIPF